MKLTRGKAQLGLYVPFSHHPWQISFTLYENKEGMGATMFSSSSAPRAGVEVTGTLGNWAGPSSGLGVGEVASAPRQGPCSTDKAMSAKEPSSAAKCWHSCESCGGHGEGRRWKGQVHHSNLRGPPWTAPRFIREAFLSLFLPIVLNIQ